MKERKFAALTLAVEELISRRRAFATVASSIFAPLLALRQPPAAEATIRMSTGGGFNGAACHYDGECHGGLCEMHGKCLKRTRYKRRHLTIVKRTGKCRCTCAPGRTTCSQSTRAACARLTDDTSGERRVCYCRAGSDATICGDVAFASCVVCATDADCLAETGPGSVCAAVSGDCACQNGSPTTCVPPCTER